MTTANVTVTLVDASLDAVEGARVTAKLFFPESLIDFIAPESSEVTGTTDAAGQAVLAVWPNALNTTVQTYYKFRAWHPTTKAKILDVCAYVPNTASDLEDLAYECRGTTSGSTGAAESAALSAHINDPTDAHDASAISVLDTAENFTGTDAESVLAELAGQGLQYFTEARDIAAPNDTYPVHSLTASGAESRIDAVVAPTGGGALSASIADSLAAGGNKRGYYSVDWQTERVSATEVASGYASSITGGSGNTSSGTYSAALGGADNIASGNGSVVMGRRAIDRGIRSRLVFADGYITDQFAYVAGNSQVATQVLHRAATGATATILSASGSDPALVSNIVSVLPDNHAYAITARVIGRDAATGDILDLEIKASAQRGANAASTTVNAAAATEITRSAGAATWAVSVVANATRGSAEVQVTGEAAKTIHWTCRFDTVEVG